MMLRRCILTENDCFRAGRAIVPRGIMLHSTGADNPALRRYVQPDDGVLGPNRLGNHWNRPGIAKCVHAFVGKAADGTVSVYQTLPWDHRGWHCGGAGNDTHISIELCEDGLEDGAYFSAVYGAAAELAAMLCRQYGLDPLADGTVIDHREGHARKIASNHGDVAHWFGWFGKTMDDFRSDIANLLVQEEPMTQEQFHQMMDRYLDRLARQEPSGWSAEARAWAEGSGLIRGGGDGENRYPAFCTREEAITFLYRLSHPEN